MERELLNAAQEGSVETLLKLLQQDELILRRYISGCSKETPLHIAAMFGHLEFTKEVLRHMPEMAKELDYRKSTPLHVATANGHILVVKELLPVNPEMCFARDQEGRNPVHVAVIKEHIEILKELVQFRPQAAKALLGASNILHLCVKHHQEEAFKYLLEVFRDDVEFVNSKDEEEFTILHLAVAEKQTEVVKLLIQHHQVEVNARNKYGLRALDISLACGRRNIKDKEVAECFQQTRELGATSTTTPAKVVAKSNSKTTVHCFGSMARPINSYDRECNTLMLVASIIATVTFQAMINPPKSLSGDFKTSNTLSFSAAIGIMLLLISGFPLKRKILIWLLRIIMWIAVMSAAATYYVVMDTVTDEYAGMEPTPPPFGLQPPAPPATSPPMLPLAPPPKAVPPPPAAPPPKLQPRGMPSPEPQPMPRLMPPPEQQPMPRLMPPPAMPLPAPENKLGLVWLVIIILTLGFAIGIFIRIVRWMKQKTGQAISNTQDQSSV